MKIAFNIDFDYTRFTGIGRYGIEIISAWNKSGNSCELWMNQSTKGNPPIIDGKNANIKYYPKPRRITDYFWPKLYAQKNKINWVHSTNGILLPSNSSFKQIAVIYDLTPFHHSHMKTDDDTLGWQSRIKNIVNKADCITVISKSTLADLLNLFPEVKEKAFLTTLGIDHFASKKALLKKKKHLLSVGTIEPRKNTDGLLKAYSILNERNNDIPPLVLAGMDGFRADEYKKLASDLGINKKVRFTGFISDEELAVLYSEAYCLIHPAHYEGFGFTVPEAFTWNLPVVAANTSGLHEFFKESAWMVDPTKPESIADGIINALSKGITISQSEDRKRLSKILTWANCARQTLNAIKTVDS